MLFQLYCIAMEASQVSNTIVSIMYDEFRYLLQFLSAEDLFCFRRVSKRWKQFIEESPLWKKYLQEKGAPADMPNRQHFISSLNNLYTPFHRYQRICQAETKLKRGIAPSIQHSKRQQKTQINCLRFDDHLLASGGSNCIIELRDLHTGNVTSLMDRGVSIETLEFRNQLMITGNSKGVIKYWNLDNLVRVA